MTLKEYYKAGEKSCIDKDFDKAIEYFNGALGIDENHVASLYGRALACFKLQRFAQAIEDFNLVIELEPANANYFSERGVALHLYGNNEAAIKDFDRAAELEPQNPYRYSSRAYIKDTMGDLKGAIRDYKMAIYLDPEDAIAYNNLGIVQEKLGNHGEAKESFKKADSFENNNINSQVDNNSDGETKTNNAAHNKQFSYQNSNELREPSSNAPHKGTSSIESHADDLKITFPQYVGTLKNVFSDQRVFKDFLGYVKGLLKRKNG